MQSNVRKNLMEWGGAITHCPLKFVTQAPIHQGRLLLHGGNWQPIYMLKGVRQMDRRKH